MCRPCDNNGFTLLEILISVVVLSVGFMAIAGVTVSTMRGRSFSAAVTTATTLAQDKMEDIRRLNYSGLPSTNSATVEDYGAIADYLHYKRVVSTKISDPAAGMKTAAVAVYWDSDNHSVSLETIIAK